LNKTAIVTGGTSGIGWGISKKFASQGYNLVIFAAESIEENKDPLAYLDEHKMPYIYLQGDLANLDDHQRLLNAAVDRFRRIDVLMNNAGVVTLCRQDIMLLTTESFDHVLNINLRGTFFLSQKIAAQMMKQEEIDGYRGIIINTESSNSTVVSIQRGEYCMSKAGLSMMTQLLAARLGKESIFVYGIRPGIIATRKTYQVKEKYDIVTSSDEMIIKRWGQPEDCAEAVWAFCSNDLRYCTGTVINVDGGLIQRRL
jgi:NAD(P)-dependent dehydrogenase (short-subunit alcohol dehydrogenase family)